LLLIFLKLSHYEILRFKYVNGIFLKKMKKGFNHIFLTTQK